MRWGVSERKRMKKSVDRSDYLLVVEDNPLLRLLLAESLTIADYKVVETGSADEALKLLSRGKKFALVITDIEMPGSMDGLALANVIHERWPEIALIVTSGRVQPAAGELPIGAKFVKKPSVPHAFIQVVQSLLIEEKATTSAHETSIKWYPDGVIEGLRQPAP